MFIVQLLLLAEGDDATAAALLDGYHGRTARGPRAATAARATAHRRGAVRAALALYDALIDDETRTPRCCSPPLCSRWNSRTWIRRVLPDGSRRSGARDDVAFLLGQVEQQAGNVDAALGWYAQVDGPNATDAAVRIARLHAAEGEIDRAREMLQQLRDQMPEDSVTLFLIEGEMLRQNDAEEQAMAVYDQAIAGLPDDPDLRYARAMVAVGLDRVDLLESDLRHILAGPGPRGCAERTRLYPGGPHRPARRGAFELIEQAYALKPDEPAIKDSMGWVLYRLGDPAAAEPYLRRPWKEAFDPEIAAHLGEVLWALGRKEEATAIWDRALEEARSTSICCVSSASIATARRRPRDMRSRDPFPHTETSRRALVSLATTRRSPAGADGAWLAPAKLNLMLRVLGRRPDGYHRLQTVFQFIDRCDRLFFEPTQDGRSCGCSGLAGVHLAGAGPRDARCAGAARGNRAATPRRPRSAWTSVCPWVAVSAAAVRTPPPRCTRSTDSGAWPDTDALAEIGLALGADVPVFVRGRPPGRRASARRCGRWTAPGALVSGVVAADARLDGGGLLRPGIDTGFRSDHNGGLRCG
jgi:tetratricopeptide (TPR) repeat protein